MKRVVRVNCEDYSRAVEGVAHALQLLGGAEKFASRGEALLIKPNLLAAHKPEENVTTHPAILEGAIRAALDVGAKVTVGDSPGLGSLERVAKKAGLSEICSTYGVELVELGSSGVGNFSGKTYKGLELAEAAVSENRVWNLPKFKTHTMMGLTLGVKNLYGCLPGKRKALYHFRAGQSPESFAALLLDIHEIVSPALTILDGVRAMDGPGPSRGDEVKRSLIIASANTHALDYEAMRLAGFTPEGVPTVKLALERGELKPEDIEVVGDDAEVIPFTPAPGSPAEFRFVPGPVRPLLRRILHPFPRFDKNRCVGCGVCVEACPGEALKLQGSVFIDSSKCIRCYCCQELCPHGAVDLPTGLARLRG
ncbi:MAG: (4Fe-4S)-binding protein [Deltaproteobacteria bacterium]|nr:MAG: (4Fe-4S)-binding protein [Deltaproteobacteria bacterium]